MAPLTLGLVVHRGRMLLGPSHVLGLGWLRPAHRDALARLWNQAACAVLGHDRERCVLPGPRPCCAHCEEPLRRTRAELAYAAVNERLIWGDAGEARRGEAPYRPLRAQA